MSKQLQNYIFASSNEPILLAASSFENMERVCGSFFVVSLENDKELELLMCLLGIKTLAKTSLPNNEDFSAFFDFSRSQLPELDGSAFNTFYDAWLKKSGRNSTMDEYGQLVFFQGLVANWNSKSYWFVLIEKA
jgi:hypothetical protein